LIAVCLPGRRGFARPLICGADLASSDDSDVADGTGKDTFDKRDDDILTFYCVLVCYLLFSNCNSFIIFRPFNFYLFWGVYIGFFSLFAADVSRRSMCV